MILTSYSFGHKDPEPKEEDYFKKSPCCKASIYTALNYQKCYNCAKTLWDDVWKPVKDKFEKDHAEWSAKNVQPEPDAIYYFDESTPRVLQEVYYSSSENFNDKKVYCRHNGHWAPGPDDKLAKCWTDKSTYDQKLSYFKEHQTIFDGFNVKIEGDTCWADNGKVRLFFFTYEGQKRLSVFLIGDPDMDARGEHCLYSGAILDENEFRLICKRNGIEP